MSKKKILVTGAGGHIGNTLCAFLKEEGHTVCGLDIVKNAQTEAIFKRLGIRVIYGDINDIPLLKRCFQGIDVVVHCASLISIGNKNDADIERTNIAGTRAVVEAAIATKISHLIHFSSLHAFDYDSKTPIIDENTPLATTHKITYNRTKALATEFVLSQTKIPHVTILAPSGVIGRNDYKPSEMGTFILQVAKKQQYFMPSGGFDWTDVRDVCAATCAAIRTPPRKTEMYILSGNFAAMMAVADAVIALGQERIRYTHIPTWAVRMALPIVSIYARLTRSAPRFTSEALYHIVECNPRVSYQKAQRDLQYAPRPFVEMIVDALAWYRENGMLDRKK